VTKVFLDTNVLIYANDSRDPAKQSRAIEVVTECMRERTGVVSTQVLQEYAVVALQKLNQDPDIVLRQLLLMESIEVVQITPELVRRGLEIQSRYRISYWDGAIIAAAEHANSNLALSEDLAAGELYGTVRVQNPFVETGPRMDNPKRSEEGGGVDNAEDFQKVIERVWAKITRSLDQDLALVRDEYRSLPDEERKLFREWVEGLCHLEDPAIASVYASARVQMAVPYGEDTRAATVSIGALKRALEAWDRGEEYLPDRLDDL
jgi:predicted nucleic acid-binding protein